MGNIKLTLDTCTDVVQSIMREEIIAPNNNIFIFLFLLDCKKKLLDKKLTYLSLYSNKCFESHDYAANMKQSYMQNPDQNSCIVKLLCRAERAFPHAIIFSLGLHCLVNWNDMFVFRLQQQVTAWPEVFSELSLDEGKESFWFIIPKGTKRPVEQTNPMAWSQNEKCIFPIV